jgi:putative transposase
MWNVSNADGGLITGRKTRTSCFDEGRGAVAKFRDIKTLQKFAAAHTSIHNHFNLDRHLNRRDVFKQNRSAALAEWRQLAA